MLREIDLSEISDGKLYTGNDMVKADCRGCAGCSSCCQGMGSSIILDPLDIFRLTGHLSKSFEQLLEEALELNVKFTSAPNRTNQRLRLKNGSI